jgi:hypothetical protein
VLLIAAFSVWVAETIGPRARLRNMIYLRKATVGVKIRAADEAFGSLFSYVA